LPLPSQLEQNKVDAKFCKNRITEDAGLNSNDGCDVTIQRKEFIVENECNFSQSVKHISNKAILAPEPLTRVAGIRKVAQMASCPQIEKEMALETFFKFVDDFDLKVTKRNEQTQKRLNGVRKLKSGIRRGQSLMKCHEHKENKQTTVTRDLLANGIDEPQTQSEKLSTATMVDNVETKSSTVPSAICVPIALSKVESNISLDDNKVVDSGEGKYSKGMNHPQPSPVLQKLPATNKNSVLVADQNTASTLPDTLSSMSVIRASIQEGCKVSGEMISSGMYDSNIIKNNDMHELPLSTLLSVPGGAGSNSSVLSSLEGPHAFGRCSSEKENDVGYHLLSVCKGLSSEISLFMARRSQAVFLRRRERRILLSALQDSVLKVWPRGCRAEMYGSCATQLDLPSSDLDVVICGLKTPTKGRSRKCRFASAKEHTHKKIRDTVNIQRLASKLDLQPWTVQVRVISTATVPVIKLLVDPSRLPDAGVSAGGDTGIEENAWNSNPQSSSEYKERATYNHLTSIFQPLNLQLVSNIPHKIPVSVGMAASTLPPVPSVPIMPKFSAPWRGADILNGLIQVDITFEGPEHSGINSTAYAARVVQESCNKTGLAPDATPLVQVLMVLKEFLAQRKLNEPFSGGLSSYALLLMVIAMIKEQKIIRTQMKLAEKHCKVATVEGSNDILEVLCSGEQTTGKLLMHFLLYFGKFFDAERMAVDVTGSGKSVGPIIARNLGLAIDPATGMLTRDSILIFDPRKGALGNNIAQSCFAWHKISSVFSECFGILTNTVERRDLSGNNGASEKSQLLELLLSS